MNGRNIIQLFFEKNYSKNTQLLFRKWFQLDVNQTDKNEAMQELWDKSPSVVTKSTLEDLAKLKELMVNEQPSFSTVHRSLYVQIVKYAAVIALVVMSSVITYYVAKPSSLEFAEFSVPSGECKRMQLSDGSTVWLNAGSTLIYPKTFSTDTRTVYLCGEANFSVTKNPHKPFIVRTNHLAVQALGTKFDVRSYPYMTFTTATLVEGSIKVKTSINSTRGYVLKPDQQLSYSHQTHDVSIAQVDAAKVTSWRKGYLIFQGGTFDDIVSTLERKYNIQINYDADKYKGRSYYVKFNPDESIEHVLSVLCQLNNQTSYKKHGSDFYIHSKE